MLDLEELVSAWGRVGVRSGMHLIVHSSLSSLGPVSGGAATVVESLRRAAGPSGTIVAPAFVSDRMGAIAEAVLARPDVLLSPHPQVPVAAFGSRAASIVAEQPLAFALGPGSPFGKLHDLAGHILLVGVGHNRNSFLHHAETLVPQRRLKVRRFEMVVDGARVRCEEPDVANDNDTLFPVVGRDFEVSFGIQPVRVGSAECRLLPVRPFVDFAARRLGELLVP